MGWVVVRHREKGEGEHASEDVAETDLDSSLDELIDKQRRLSRSEIMESDEGSDDPPNDNGCNYFWYGVYGCAIAIVISAIATYLHLI